MVHSTIGSTVHSMLLKNLEHWICTTTMTNIRSDKYSNMLPPGYGPVTLNQLRSKNVPARSENFMKRDEDGLEILSFTTTQHSLK